MSIEAPRRRLLSTTALTARLEIAYRPVNDLKPDPQNARTHSAKQVAQIAVSIREFGFANPILLDETGQIIAGHARWAAAKKAGLTEVPTITLTGLSKAQRRALAIADNKLPLGAGWDEVVLKETLIYLSDPEIALEAMTGF